MEGKPKTPISEKSDLSDLSDEAVVVPKSPACASAYTAHARYAEHAVIRQIALIRDPITLEPTTYLQRGTRSTTSTHSASGSSVM